MTAETLAGLVAILVSLLFGYIPGLKTWYENKPAEQKAGIMGVLVILVAVGVFALSCGAIYDFGVTCDKSGAIGLLQILIAALVANQGTFLLAVKPYQSKV